MSEGFKKVEANLWRLVCLLETGVITPQDTQRISDTAIAEMDEPPIWLIDLSLAAQVDEAVGVLFGNNISWPERTTSEPYYLACLAHQHGEGAMPWNVLLRRAAEKADANSWTLDCEHFYWMLNELEHHDLSPLLEHSQRLEMQADLSQLTSVEADVLSVASARFPIGGE